jgi:hypothetical protein
MLYRVTSLRGITSQENHHSYSRINVTKSPAASISDVSKPRLTSQLERVRAYISVFLESVVEGASMRLRT